MTQECPGTEDKLSSVLSEYRTVEKKKLILSLSITLIIMTIELMGGLVINSLALVSDAGHMFTHAFAILIGLVAIIIAQKPPCHHKTYGMYRSEVLAALINGLFLLIVVLFIILESIERFLNPMEINGFMMLILAIIGLFANVTSIFILRGSQNSDLNIKSVFYHMFADAIASIGIVIIAFFIIFNPEWSVLDPIISVGISIVILAWAIGILKDSVRILLEMSPKGYNVDMISNALKKEFPEILDLFSLHLWTITSGMSIFSAHVRIPEENWSISKQEALIEKINKFLLEKYKIVESTLQFTVQNEPQSCFFK